MQHHLQRRGCALLGDRHLTGVSVGTCGLGNYALPEPTPSAARDGAPPASGAAGGSFSLRIPRGLASTVLAVQGVGAPPLLTLAEPRGAGLTMPASGSLVTGDVWVSEDRTTDMTYVALAHPAPGDLTLHTQAGSSRIASVREANPAPAPRITAMVRLTGCSEQIACTLHPASGDSVAICAQNDAERTFLGDARPGSHTLHLLPPQRIRHGHRDREPRGRSPTAKDPCDLQPCRVPAGGGSAQHPRTRRRAQLGRHLQRQLVRGDDQR